jgi:hypothetical protein
MAPVPLPQQKAPMGTHDVLSQHAKPDSHVV